MSDIEGSVPVNFLTPNAYDNYALSMSTQSIYNGKVCADFDGFEAVQEPQFSTTKQLAQEFIHDIKIIMGKICSRKTLLQRFPILDWLPKYSKEDAIGDFLAGITVGLTVIPQSLAYASIAHVPLQYGLYTSFLGCILYIFLGTCKDLPFGPTAMVSLLTYEAIQDKSYEYAVVLCFLIGIIQLFMGLFKFGFIIDFISGPVSSGFTSAVALIILTSQVKDLLGIPTSGSVFIHIWSSIFKNIHHTKLYDALLGVICIGCLLLLRKGSKFAVSTVGEDGLKRSKYLIWSNKLFWFITTSRNAILLIVCGYIAFCFFQNGLMPFTLIGSVPQGLPSVKVPPFTIKNKVGNGTATVSFGDIVSELGSGIIVVPLLALLENTAICKAFADGGKVNPSQEFLAIGICNIANSFVQAFPASGSLSRSAIQHCSGARTPMCGLYAGALVVLALLFFTPCFYYIPKATLAAVVIAAVVFLVEVKVIRPMWRSKKRDLVLGVATFIACLVFPIEKGIAIGIGANFIFIFHQVARPKISIEILKTRNDLEYLMITPDRCLIFPSVEYVKNLVNKQSERRKIPVVIDCSHVYGADYTAACVIERLTTTFFAKKQLLVFYNLKPTVGAVLEGVDPKDLLVAYDEQGLQLVLENKSTMKSP